MSSFASSTVPCPRCRTHVPLFPSGAATDGTAPAYPGRVQANCPECRCQFDAHLFPGFFTQRERPTAPLHFGLSPPETTTLGATCFFHSQRPASVSCERCGRFVCALCDMEIAAKHFCPDCLSQAHAGGTLVGVEPARVRYDTLAWTSLILGLLLCTFLLPLVALGVIGVAIWKHNAPPSRLVRSQLRLWLAAIVSLVLFVGGVFLMVRIFGSNF